MGTAEDAARRHGDDRSEQEAALMARLSRGWRDRMIKALPIALRNLEQHDYPLEVPGSGMGRWITWGGEDRYAWPLMFSQEQDNKVYLVVVEGEGILLLSPFEQEAFRRVSVNEAAHPAVAQALERMAEFGGGPSRYRTRRLSWWQVFGW